MRAVLDRCEAVIGEVRGVSLLDVMFGRASAEGGLNDPQWERSATYALECALTALWSSVGIKPGIALGTGTGSLAAAQAAGVLSLEDGLRLAAVLDDPGAVLDDIEMGSPALTLVNTVSGRTVAPDEILDADYWRQHVASKPGAFDDCVETLAATGVDVIIEIGPNAAWGTRLKKTWPAAAGNTPAPLVLSSLDGSSDSDATPEPGSTSGFVDAVASAYEAGLTLSFAGLFAGETRRRVSLPDYPFERRRHWI